MRQQSWRAETGLTMPRLSDFITISEEECYSMYQDLLGAHNTLPAQERETEFSLTPPFDVEIRAMLVAHHFLI